jgi:hypothetical protein
MQLQGMMQQMGGMLEHIATRIQAGPMTPEQTKEVGELMGHIAEMTNHLAWMMGGGKPGTGRPDDPMAGRDMPQQMAAMMERITQMYKRVAAMTVPSQPASPSDKK